MALNTDFNCFVLVSYFRDKHAAEGHRGAKTHAKTHGYDLIIGAEVNGHKGQPDNTGGVHGKGNILGLIEISWHVTSLWEKKENKKFRAVLVIITYTLIFFTLCHIKITNFNEGF